MQLKSKLTEITQQLNEVKEEKQAKISMKKKIKGY